MENSHLSYLLQLTLFESFLPGSMPQEILYQARDFQFPST